MKTIKKSILNSKKAFFLAFIFASCTGINCYCPCDCPIFSGITINFLDKKTGEKVMVGPAVGSAINTLNVADVNFKTPNRSSFNIFYVSNLIEIEQNHSNSNICASMKMAFEIVYKGTIIDSLDIQFRGTDNECCKPECNETCLGIASINAKLRNIMVDKSTISVKVDP